ncbi:MAG TPA: 50S ribosomal protein L10 [Candidatus Saccharimonadales bacterium]|nr:50S ribosomal protein L10 [Candidatus Saccharimonadales bacterium]
MALTRAKKTDVVDEVAKDLQASRLTTVAKYQGTSVASMMELRRLAAESNTKIKVFKNRLVIKALESNDKFSGVDKAVFKNMLLYSFNPDDEIASAQVLYKYAKDHPSIEIIGAINDMGELINSEDTKVLAALPNLGELRGMLVGTIRAPLSGTLSVLSVNTRSLLSVLDAKSRLS